MFLGHLSHIDSQHVMFDEHHGSDHKFTPYESNVSQHHDEQTGIIILGSVFLIERDVLLEKLGIRNPHNDLVLVLEAYQKWGEQCLSHLVGFFVFALWNDKEKELLVATDHNGNRSCFYAFAPNKYFYVSDSFRAITNKMNTLTINQNMFVHFALNSLPGAETCYKEIVKLPAAHYLLVGHKKFKIKCYWRLLDHHQTLPYKKREDYYAAFQDIFTRSVKDCLRSETSVAAHISGGLDSSSVACVAAKLLSAQNKTLYGFTALPRDLSGPSYRENWQYHEMPKVQDILNQYPNIQHHRHFTDPNINVFETLSSFYSDIDQPCWAIFNLDWIIGSIRYAAQNQCRIILDGAKGNGTISWEGQSFRERIRKIPSFLQNYFGCSSAYQANLPLFNPAFMQSKIAGNIHRERNLYFNTHYWMLRRSYFWQRVSSVRPLATHHGIEILDPTGTLPIQLFCYRVPQWVYHQPGAGRLGRRLLVREGMSSIVPESVRMNPQRGEQAADWYLSYHHHRKNWHEQLQQLSPETLEVLWSMYEQEKIMALIQQPSTTFAQNKETTRDIRLILLSCLSMGFFYESLLLKNKIR